MNTFLLIAALAAGLGLLSLSNATKGVGLIAFAIFLVACARIVQADAHQKAQQDDGPLPASERFSGWVGMGIVLMALAGVAIVLMTL